MLLGALIASILIYWPGLAGPFLFDDEANLAQIQRWLAGRASWYEAMFGTGSGVLLRPVSMATFAANAFLGGMSPTLFKLVNLVLHLCGGLLVWQFARILLARDRRLAPHAVVLSGFVAVFWLLHPLHASTVLYVVQRMAQLSALFSLAAVCIFVSARLSLEAGDKRSAHLRMFLAFPTLLLAGVLSKENAIVTPALCGVIEVAYFARASRQTSVRMFFAVFLLLPALAAVALGLLSPQRVLGAYDERTFTLVERLLTQGRVLIDYVGQLLLPNASRMGLYVDDFPISRGLSTPVGTLFSWLSIIVLSILAWLSRTRSPTIFAGWYFFLVAHSLESTILPLEMYFEHRNYLPSAGLLLAVVAVSFEFLNRAIKTDRTRDLLSKVVCVTFVALLASSTLNRSLVWRTKESIASDGIASHPESLRANLDFATVMLQSGRFDEAMATMQRLSTGRRSANRMIGHLGMATVDCLRSGSVSESDIENAVSSASDTVRLEDYQAIGLLVRVNEDRRCAGLSDSMLADLMLDILSAANLQPDARQPKWRLRMITAKQLARANRLPEALAQARLAWQPTADVGVGSVLVQIYALMDMPDEAEATLQEMESRLGRFEQMGFTEIQRLRDNVLGDRQPSASTPTPRSQ